MSRANPAASMPPDHRRSTVLLARLRPPVRPAHHVRRDRLHVDLDDAAQAPLTLLVAPAGSGKTVLLSAWAGENDLATAWLSVDESDQRGGQLWDDIGAALQHAHPSLELGLERAGRPDEPPE